MLWCGCPSHVAIGIACISHFALLPYNGFTHAYKKFVIGLSCNFKGFAIWYIIYYRLISLPVYNIFQLIEFNSIV